MRWLYPGLQTVSKVNHVASSTACLTSCPPALQSRRLDFNLDVNSLQAQAWNSSSTGQDLLLPDTGHAALNMPNFLLASKKDRPYLAPNVNVH